MPKNITFLTLDESRKVRKKVLCTIGGRKSLQNVFYHDAFSFSVGKVFSLTRIWHKISLKLRHGKNCRETTYCRCCRCWRNRKEDWWHCTDYYCYCCYCSSDFGWVAFRNSSAPSSRHLNRRTERPTPHTEKKYINN